MATNIVSDQWPKKQIDKKNEKSKMKGIDSVLSRNVESLFAFTRGLDP